MGGIAGWEFAHLVEQCLLRSQYCCYTELKKKNAKKKNPSRLVIIDLVPGHLKAKPLGVLDEVKLRVTQYGLRSFLDRKFTGKVWAGTGAMWWCGTTQTLSAWVEEEIKIV
jgi:hypothetical protein